MFRTLKMIFTNRYGGGVSYRKCRGQILILSALLMPLLLMFVGVGLDLGWYYLNVSRMSNAADAAVTAGVSKFLEGGDESLYSDYKDTALIDKVPSHILKDPVTGEAHIADRDKSDGDTEAKVYVKKNLSLNSAAWSNNKIADDWTKTDTSFSSTLWGYDLEDKNTLYYQVVLEEDIEHLLMPGWFEPMHATVSAVSKLTRYYLPKSVPTYEYEKGPNLFEQMKAVELAETYDSWTAIQQKKGSNSAADNRSVLSTGNYYTSGKKYRTETLTLNGMGGRLSNSGQSVGYGTVDQTGYDDLFIDWRADITTEATSDWDLDGNHSSNATYSWQIGDSSNDKLKYRVYGLINFSANYPVRSDKNPPDPLYARIESEPINADGGNYGSTVRQIIININVDNTAYTYQNIGTDSDGNAVYKKVYKYRPILFFYEGPQKLDENSTARDSKPVILNLNADFRGVLFAPNSPVVVNGNGHSFEGMVIAKSFVQLATSGKNKNTDITGITFYTDNYGNIQYQKNSDGSYKTIQPTIDPATDPALILTDEEIALGVTVQDKYFFLFDDNVKFYNKADFNLSKSVFDAFDQALMTEYGYLNQPENLIIRTDSNGNLIANTDYRSINNLFTVEDAVRSD